MPPAPVAGQGCLARSISSWLVQRTLHPSKPAFAVYEVPEQAQQAAAFAQQDLTLPGQPAFAGLKFGVKR